MRLYSRVGATSVTHEGTTYQPDDSGAFNFDEAVGQHLHSFHVAKKPMWEDEIERQRRLMDEEMERRKDPATLLDAVNKLVAASQAADVPAQEKPVPRQKAPAAKAATDADPA